MAAPICGVPAPGRRRTFWTTQLCRVEKDCGDDCGVYGLQLYCPDDPVDCVNHRPGKQRSIRTDDYVRSLVLNILLTDGRKPARECGYRPGTRGGHWSDSFRTGAGSQYTAGSLVRNLTSHGRISDAVAELQAIAQYDLNKLIAYGVATEVQVEAKYTGNNTARLDITVLGRAGDETKIGISAERVRNSWAWST